MELRVHLFACQLVWIVSVAQQSAGKALHGPPGVGRNLIIKTLPSVDDFQSNVFEVFMEPYLYDFQRPAGGERTQKQIDLQGPQGRSIPGIQAVVTLQGEGDSGVKGELVFTQIVPNGPVTVEGNVTGLPAGLHGVHVHQKGALREGCKDLGPHFIAYYGRHGGPRDHVRHVGDLGNIKAGEGPVAVKIVDHLVSLAGPRSIVGRSLAISMAEDDYGKAGTEDSALTGTSGPAVACGIIGYLN